MPRYVDGFLIPVPKKNLEAYRRMSRKAGKVWREHGALEYRECAGDDLKVKGAVPFPRLVKCKPGETVVFAWILYKSRADRDRVNARVMKDPRVAKMMEGQSCHSTSSGCPSAVSRFWWTSRSALPGALEEKRALPRVPGERPFTSSPPDARGGAPPAPGARE